MITDETKVAYEILLTRYELELNRAIEAEIVLMKIVVLPYWKRFNHLNHMIYKYFLESKPNTRCPSCGWAATEKESGAIYCTTVGCPNNLAEQNGKENVSPDYPQKSESELLREKIFKILEK